MMDLGTVLSIISLGYEITKDLYSFYSTWKDCEKDVADLREHLIWLHNAFRVAREIIRRPDLSTQAVDLLYSAIGACNDSANELRDILEKIRNHETPATAWDKLKAHGRKACYPFRKPTVLSVKANVDACCDEIHLAVDLLQLDTVTGMHKALQDMDRKLGDGFGSMDAILRQLPVVGSTIQAVGVETSSIKEDTSILRRAKEKEDMLAWICPTDYSSLLNDFYARRQEGTGIWFLQSPEYLAWTKGTSRILLCPGPPGAGKTIMAATVINDLLQSAETASVAVAYVFCNYKRQEEQDTNHILAALVRQLLHNLQDEPTALSTAYVNHKSRNTRPSQDELNQTLSSLAREFRKVYIVIDALDECRDEVRYDLLAILQARLDNEQVHLMMTSRPLQEILKQAPTATRIEIRALDLDVVTFLKAQIKTLPRFVREDPQLQHRIVAMIASAVDGMFLLAQLHLNSLKDCLNKRSLNKAMATLPRGSKTEVYVTVYSDAMGRIFSQSEARKDVAKEALSLIVRALRPLRSREFQHALAVELNAGAFELGEDDLHDLDEVVSLCAGLVAEDEHTGVIRLIHYTAQNFFEKNWTRWVPNADTIIATKCVGYLFSGAFRAGPCNTYEEWEARLTKHPFFDYAAMFWSAHVSSALTGGNKSSIMPLKSLAVRFLQDQQLVMAVLSIPSIRGYHHGVNLQMFAPGTQGLHLAVRLGMECLVQALLDAGFPVNCRDSADWTPLAYATKGGFTEIVKLLLHTESIDVDPRDKDGRTPLAYSARCGKREIVDLLLVTGQVGVNSKDRFGLTPLMEAATFGFEGIVKLFIATVQVDINAKNAAGRTALSLAAIYGHAGPVRQLIATDQVDVNSRDRFGRTPLRYAAHFGHERIVQLLIAIDAVDINSKDQYGCTALSSAVEVGGVGIVQLLVANDRIDLESKDNNGRTPLWYAIERGQSEIVSLLEGALCSRIIQDICSYQATYHVARKEEMETTERA